MSRQNIYDNEAFFEGYHALRADADSPNHIEEKPALSALLGDVRGKRILDLGCGYGDDCAAFFRLGAAEVIGIDISIRMIDFARKQNPAENIEYLVMAIEDMNRLHGPFDIVVSSLAVHYVEDFTGLATQVFSLLSSDGIFLFSQEHPLTTAPIEGAQWVRKPDGSVDHYRLTDYSRSGKRAVSWLVDGVVKYHRTFSDLVNGLSAAGFIIAETSEPSAPEEVIRRLPRYGKTLHKPDFLLVKAYKPGFPII